MEGQLAPTRRADYDAPDWRLLALGLYRPGAAAEHARHAIDQRVGVGEVVGVVAAKAAGRPAQNRRANVLGAGQEVVVADLVNPGRLGIPLVGGAGQRLLHELVPDRRCANDPGRVVAERGVVGVADPDRGRQRRRIADGPVVAEGLRRARLGGLVAAGQGQVAVAAEFLATVAVFGHVRDDDDGHIGVYRL